MDWRKRRQSGVNVLLRPQVSAETLNGSRVFAVLESKRLGDVLSYCKVLESQGSKVRLIPVYGERVALSELKKFKKAKNDAERRNSGVNVHKVENIGQTRRLEVLPLIDWKTGDERLRTETGVSYLLKTDDRTILFDAGLNRDDEVPSPLLKNMEALGVEIDDVDTIFLSHNHGDHVGGERWRDKNTFSVTGDQRELKVDMVYTPVKMTYPGLNPLYARDPTIIGEGLATTGTISNALYFAGAVEEQSLAVNVSGRGIVLIVGCGHQTVPLLLDRVKAVFDQPLYGVIGGLHYPVMGGPLELYGFAPHKYSGTGKAPWEPITVDELLANIELIKGTGVKLVALSPHDSSDLSLKMFQDAFPDEYRSLRVGEKLVVA